jgi:hypothetical protein
MDSVFQVRQSDDYPLQHFRKIILKIDAKSRFIKREYEVFKPLIVDTKTVYNVQVANTI